MRDRGKYRAYIRQWKRDRIAAGLCAHCLKNMAGADGGTRTLCGGCATIHRDRQRAKVDGVYIPKKRGPKPKPKTLLPNRNPRTAVAASTISNQSEDFVDFASKLEFPLLTKKEAAMLRAIDRINSLRRMVPYVY